MMAKTPAMGWNTWNTFGQNISDKLIRETADVMVEKGYKDAGYEYVVIDDCWSLRDRNEAGELVADPEKFPEGMKAVADYVHSKGLKFGMYSCAGVRTCAGYPASFDHEYQDAGTFASWGVDFLKYDFCYFPSYADGKHRYLTMSMALKSTGRDILFSACNWGTDAPWNWMRTVGAQMYRSTGDIIDTWPSTENIMRSQINNFNANASGCFNDMDMLTIGMFGKGLVGRGEDTNTMDEYETQFAFWCMCGAPLMMGGDIRSMREDCRSLLQNKNYIAIQQDEECRPPMQIQSNADNGACHFVRHMANHEILFGLFNFTEGAHYHELFFYTCGIPVSSAVDLELTDVKTGKVLGRFRDHYAVTLPKHGCQLLRAKFVPRG